IEGDRVGHAYDQVLHRGPDWRPVSRVPIDLQVIRGSGGKNSSVTRSCREANVLRGTGAWIAAGVRGSRKSNYTIDLLSGGRGGTVESFRPNPRGISGRL